MTTARPSPQVDSPEIHLSLSDARQMGPEGEMWVAVITLAIFDATRKIGIKQKLATKGAKKWRKEEYKLRNALKKESRKWLRRGCIDFLGQVDVLGMLGIDPSWFHRVVQQAHPELR